MKKNRREFRTLYLYLVVFLIAELSILITGLRYYNDFEKNFNANVENQLRLISDLKVRELGHWIGEQRADAEIVFGNDAFAKYVKHYFKNPADSAVKREIKIWLKEFKTGFDYDAVFLTDTLQIRRIFVTDEPETPSSNISKVNLDSLKSGKLVFSDFYVGKFKNKVFLKILIPIIELHKLFGIIELRINPQTYLYPILSNLPIQSETTETYIVRLKDKNVVYLSELKFQKNAPMNLKVPIDSTMTPDVKAALGQDGRLKGKNYHGKEVIFYVRKIPDSPWFLITQIEENEVYAQLKDKRLETAFLFFSLSFLAGMGMWIFWRNQKTRIFKERIKSTETLQKLNLAIQNSGEIVFLTDNEGIITYINPEFTKTYGYTFEEIVGKKTPRILKSGILKSEDHQSLWEALLNKQSIPKIEYFNKCKDGHLIEIEGSANPILNNDNNIIGFLGIQRDITVRKRSELEQSVNYEISNSFAHTSNLTELFKLIHQSLSKILYAKNIFVALHDENTGLFSFPYWVDEFDPVPEPEAMEKSLSSYVLRTGKPILFSPELFQQLKEQNEIELVGSPSPSWIGVPLQTPSRTIGVLVLQHYEMENVYSERDLIFLNTVGSQIAMAVERKLAEEDLRNEHLLLRTVIDNIPDSIYTKDTATRKTLANLTELLYSGVKSEAEILGKTDFDLHPKELAEGFYADDQLVLQSGKPLLNREEYVIEKNGEKHWLLTSKLPLKDKNGNIIGLVGIGRDITSRKLAEEALRESEIKLNVILQSTADGILAIDSNGKIIKTNKRFAELWRIPRSLINLGDDNTLLSYVLEQLTNPDEFTSKVQKLYHSTDEDLDNLHFKDGRTFERFSAPLVLDDSSIGRVWSFRNITERLRAEEEIRLKNEELLKANSEKDKFFSIIAHDLRGPFNGFLGLTQIMADESSSLSTEELQEMAVNMEKSASTLFRLLENLLQWARMQQGSIPFNPIGVQLLSFVNESIAIVMDEANFKRIDITVDISADLSVFADDNMLQTIIRNLVSNALKFTHKGGKVKISASTGDDNNVVVAIKDTGIGMSSEMVDNLFRLDVQTGRPGTNGESSSGLGLLLCKEFIEKHDGKIWVESEVGHGSTFYFTLATNIS